MKKSVKFKVSVIVALIGMVALATGTSYAIFTTTKPSQKVQIIETGSVSLKLVEDGILELSEAQPMTNEEGAAQAEYFSFNITNTGSTKTSYTIELVDDTDSLASVENKLDPQYVRVGLTVNGTAIDPVSLSEANRLIYTQTSSITNQVDTYQLRLWLNFGDLTQDQIDAMSEYGIYFKLKVEATQVLD